MNNNSVRINSISDNRVQEYSTVGYERQKCISVKSTSLTPTRVLRGVSNRREIRQVAKYDSMCSNDILVMPSAAAE